MGRSKNETENLSHQLDEGLGVFVPGAFKYRPILVFYLSRHLGPLLSSPQPHLLQLGTFCFGSVISIPGHGEFSFIAQFSLCSPLSLGDTSPCQPLPHRIAPPLGCGGTKTEGKGNVGRK